MNKSIILLILIIFIPFINAQGVPSQVSQSATKLEVIYPKISVVGYNENFTFHWHVQNYSALLTNSQATCSLHIYNNYGRHLLINSTPEFDAPRDFEIVANQNNFSYLGHYYGLIECNTSKEVGYASFAFDATYNSKEIPEGGQQNLLLSPLLLMIYLSAFFFGVSFLFINKVGKIIFVGISAVIFIAALLFNLVLLSETASAYIKVFDGLSTVWFIVKIFLGICLVFLIVYTLFLAYWSWLGKKGYRD